MQGLKQVENRLKQNKIRMVTEQEKFGMEFVCTILVIKQKTVTVNKTNIN